MSLEDTFVDGGKAPLIAAIEAALAAPSSWRNHDPDSGSGSGSSLGSGPTVGGWPHRPRLPRSDYEGILAAQRAREAAEAPSRDVTVTPRCITVVDGAEHFEGLAPAVRVEVDLASIKWPLAADDADLQERLHAARVVLRRTIAATWAALAAELLVGRQTNA